MHHQVVHIGKNRQPIFCTPNGFLPLDMCKANCEGEWVRGTAIQLPNQVDKDGQSLI